MPANNIIGNSSEQSHISHNYLIDWSFMPMMVATVTSLQLMVTIATLFAAILFGVISSGIYRLKCMAIALAFL